ncbi:MAG: DUF4124 domain-containing protein [Acidithiobacillus sp.]|nr:DUF4124 domain-containing protein [Acidithiobacillus sp.]
MNPFPTRTASSPRNCTPSRRQLGLFVVLLLTAPWIQGQAIYRWVSPTGVVSYGNQPPKDARQVHKIGEESPPAPVAATHSQSESKHSATEHTDQEVAKENALAARLNLLSALQNYANSQQAPRVIHVDRQPGLLFFPAYPYDVTPGVGLRPAQPPRPHPVAPPQPNNGLPPIPPWYTGPWPRQTP